MVDILLFAAVLTVAVDSLRVTVTDTLGRPIVGATVTVPALGRYGATDSGGRILLGDVRAGQYTLVVRHLGDAPGVREARVSGTTDVALTLRPASVRLAAVTVTASRTVSDPLTSSLPTDELSGEALRRAETARDGISSCGSRPVSDQRRKR